MSKGKVVFVGDAGVGKTAIIRSYQRGDEDEGKGPTVAANTISCDVKLSADKTVHLNVWDTAGQENFKCLVPMYARSAEVAVVVFDLNQKETFTHIAEWMEFFQGQTTKILIACNKKDLKQNVSNDEIEAFCREQKVQHYFTSAETRDGIDYLFYAIAQIVAQNANDIPKVTTVNFTEPNVVDNPGEKKKGCC